MRMTEQSANIAGTSGQPSARVYGRLRVFNLAAGCFHLAQAVLMLLLATGFSLPVTTEYLRFDQSTGRLVPNPQEVFQLRIGPLVAAFLLISAVAHFSLASFGYRYYVSNLKEHINRARWYEYSLSASLMIVLIGMLVGIYDLSTLILMFALNAAMIFFGYLMELFNGASRHVNWTPFVFGCLAGAVPWLVIALYTVGANQSPDTGVPGFVYGIIFSLFVFFNIFAVNMLLQYRRIGPWRDYLFGERVYIILSLVAKSALAWQIFAGTLRPV